MSFIKEFREFAVKGNVLDLAVGVIIGAAFAGIITSLVDNILMPLIGLIFNGTDFQKWAFVVRDAEIKYGLFISACVNFILIAFSLFLMIKAINRMKRNKAPVPVVLTRQEELLTEIRDQLRNRNI
jgi:large conductance mechanosensitive channel